MSACFDSEFVAASDPKGPSLRFIIFTESAAPLLVIPQWFETSTKHFPAFGAARLSFFNMLALFALIASGLLFSACETPRQVTRVQVIRFGDQARRDSKSDFSADLKSARQELYKADSPSLRRVCTGEEALAITRLRLRSSAIVCFPTKPKNKPDAAQQFLSEFDQSLQKEIATKNVFQLAEDGRGADADVYVEVYCLHNGKGHADIVTASLLSTLLVQQRRDPAVAKCNVFILRPATTQVLAAYSRATVMDPITGDRFDPLANALAKSVVAMLRELKQEPK